MARRFILLILLIIGSTSCSNSLFKVKPVTELPPLPATSRTAVAGGVTVRVAPLLTLEECQDLIDANLRASAVLPVCLQLSSQLVLPVEPTRALYRVRDCGKR